MKNLFTIVAMAGFLLPASLVSAQQWPELSDVPAVEKTGSGDVAVVVAVEDYAFLPDVPGAAKNAADWERFLADGLGVDKVLMLTNQQAVREEILSFAERGAGAVSEGSTLWFVFIGHGAPNKSADDGLLIGADGQQNANSMTARGVPQKELLAALEKGKQAKTVVLIDACFSGRDGSGGALAKGTMPVLAVDTSPVVKASTVVMTAAKADEFAGALPNTERPAFSYLVLGAMRGWADDGDGEVTADEAVTFARRELLGISGRQQTPQLTGSKGLALTKGATESMPDIAATEPQADPAPQPTTTPQQQTPIRTGGSVKLANPEHVDGKPDGPLYLSAVGGVSVVDGAFGGGGEATVGVKLNALTGGTSELRLGLRAGLASTGNPNAPTAGDSISGGEVFSDDTVQRTTNLTWVVGPEFGYGWRKEHGPGAAGDSVLTLTGTVLYGSTSGCESWSLDTSTGSREITCDPTSRSGIGAGVGLGYHYGILHLGWRTSYIIDVGVAATAGLGLTFDI